MKYSMFIGRWQPLHKGQQWLIEQRLSKGKNVLVCIRDVEADDKNPFSPQEVLENVSKHYSKEINELEKEITDFHADIAKKTSKNIDYDLIGFHGHTIYHNMDERISKQIGSTPEGASRHLIHKTPPT